MTDIFDEVGEDLRRDKLKSIWQRYNVVIIGVAVLVVVATAGWRGYETWRDARAAGAGDRFLAAIQKANDGDHAGAADALVAFASDAPSDYATLARFRIAAERAAAGETETALAVFDQLAGDGKLSTTLRDLARIRGAYIAVDREDMAAIEARIGGIDTEVNPWRHAAREILAIAAVKAEAWDLARAAVDKILADQTAPGDLRSRAQILDAVITAAVGKPAAGGPAS